LGVGCLSRRRYSCGRGTPWNKTNPGRDQAEPANAGEHQGRVIKKGQERGVSPFTDGPHFGDSRLEVHDD